MVVRLVADSGLQYQESAAAVSNEPSVPSACRQNWGRFLKLYSLDILCRRVLRTVLGMTFGWTLHNFVFAELRWMRSGKAQSEEPARNRSLLELEALKIKHMFEVQVE